MGTSSRDKLDSQSTTSDIQEPAADKEKESDEISSAKKASASAEPALTALSSRGLSAADLGAPKQPEAPNVAAAQPAESNGGQPETNGSRVQGTENVTGDEEQSPASPQGVNPLMAGLGVLFYLAVGLFIASFNLTARGFLLARWKWVLVAIMLVGAISAVLATRKWFIHASAQRRIGMIIFAVIPLVMFAVGMVIVLPVAYRAAALRIIFLLSVCLLPAIMYYLFIATKKYSILNEFIINLDRLGLLEANGQSGADNTITRETDDERRNRILTYLQKFEAVYGAFPTDLGGLVLQPTDLSRVLYARRASKDGSTFASIFTAETTVPVIMATVLIALGWLITLPPWQGALPSSGDASAQALNWLRIFTPEQTPVHFAFIGAYFFALQMLFRRYVRRDLRASAYVAVCLRIILSVIGTWVVIAAAVSTTNRFTPESISPQAANQLLVLGFVIGVFPRVAWQIIGAASKRIGGFVLRLPSLQTALPVSDLDGLTVWHETRLEEEDIENVPNMATADLVDLLLNTRFPPDRIIDWVDQAILYMHLGTLNGDEANSPRRDALRMQGIRTASALIEAYIRSEERGDLVEFEKILKDPASERSPIRSLVDTMQTNPNLRLIQTWRGLKPHEFDPQCFPNLVRSHSAGAGASH